MRCEDRDHGGTGVPGFVEVALGDCPDAPAGFSWPRAAARLPRFVGAADDAGQRLGRLSVLAIGAGSVGRAACLHLARSGVGSIAVADPARYKPESLLTHPITPADVGRPKAVDTARACKWVSPRTRTFAFDGPVQSLPPTAFAAADVVIMATDNLPAEVETGQRCISLGRPLIHAAVHGETCVAQVRVMIDSCPACHYGPAEWEHHAKSTTFSCAGFAAATDAGLAGMGRAATHPTRSVAPLCSIAADLAAIQVLRLALNLGEPLADGVLQYCGYGNRMISTPVARNPECPCDHTRWRLAAPPRTLGDCTLRDLAATAGLRDDDGVGFTVDGHGFVERAACVCGGGETRPVGRFLPVGAVAGTCPSCGRPMLAQRWLTHRPAPLDVVGAFADRPLRELTATQPNWVLARSPDATWMFCEPTDSPARADQEAV